MKKILNKLYGIVLIFLIAFMFTNCATMQPPEVVCETGEVICETGTLLCEIPQVPEEVCYYLDLMCSNLQLLCEYDYGTPEYLLAKENLNAINEMLSYIIVQEKLKVAK